MGRVAVMGKALEDHPTFMMNMESTKDSYPALELRERSIALLLSVVL